MLASRTHDDGVRLLLERVHPPVLQHRSLSVQACKHDRVEVVEERVSVFSHIESHMSGENRYLFLIAKFESALVD